MKYQMFRMLGVAVVVLTAIRPASATLLTNGDFETGDLTGWTWTPDANSTPGMLATVAAFDGSLAFRVNPGLDLAGTQRVGGVLSQTVVITAGQPYRVTGGLLAIEETPFGFGTNNGDGGAIVVRLGDLVVASLDVGFIEEGRTTQTEFDEVVVPSVTGAVDLSLSFGRRFRNDTTAVFHYADDLSVTLVPEPATLGGLALLAGCATLRRR